MTAIRLKLDMEELILDLIDYDVEDEYEQDRNRSDRICMTTG